MKNDKLQAKDLPDLPVLELLAAEPRLTYQGTTRSKWIGSAWPDAPPKVRMAKMSSLVKRCLVTGCCCGCRGDFAITRDGLEELKRLKQ